MRVSVTSGDGSFKQELQGAATLRRTLKQAGDDFKDISDANARAAQVVEEATLGLIPVDSAWLASTVRSSGTKSEGVVRVGNKSAPYAGVIHWGNPHNNIPANPFAANAAKLTEPIWGQIYSEAVEKALDRIKGI